VNNSEPIRRNARIAPHAPAYVRPDGSSVSYLALDRTVDELANRLRDLGLTPRQSAILVTADRYRYVTLSLALARINVGSAPGTFPIELADAVLWDLPQTDTGRARSVPLRELWPADVLRGGGSTPARIDDDPDAVFAYCPSSGTTRGLPKFVALTHEMNLRRIATRAISAPAIAGPRQACFVEPASVFGIGRIYRTLWSGYTVVEPSLEGQNLAAWLVSSRVNHLALAPIVLQRVLEQLPVDGVACNVETIEVGGGFLPQSTCELARQRLPAQLIATYGSTETGSVAAGPVESLQGRAYAVGHVFPGVTVEIVDDDDRPVPRGQEGTLRMRAGGAATSYVRDDEASAAVFRGGWVYPNDRAILDEDGVLRLTGRTDDVIVRGGAKVNASSIEDALRALADLREVAVFGAPDGQGHVAICAAIVPNGPLDAQEFHAHCHDRLGARAPGFIMVLSELPRNAMGKVLRNELARKAVEASRGR
jgi:acyl-coenzyme A synthetase/AMP-(fatty) acid ligase